MRQAPAAAAATLLGEAADRVERLHGGDLSEVLRVQFASGRTAVVKRSEVARAEAAMLEAIAATGAPAPAVLAVAHGLLVLEDLGRDDGPGGAWAHLGQVVRELHDATGAGYGWHADHRFGPLAIPNAPHEDWPVFWAERRLLANAGRLDPDLAARVERLAGRLGDRLPRRPHPALLHGDLWTGNVMARGSRVTGLIDPACCHGHSEVDLAMLCLFATPSGGFWDGYGPLEAGAEERRAIYQLWPALVHLHLFGPGYRELVDGLLAASGA